MTNLDLSTGAILYETGVYTDSGTIVSTSNGYVTVVFPSLVLDPIQTYQIEVDWADTDYSRGPLFLYSVTGPTEGDADTSNWHELAAVTPAIIDYHHGTFAATIGPGISDWDLAVTDNEPYLLFDLGSGTAITAIRIGTSTDPIVPPLSPVDLPCSFMRPNDLTRIPFDSETAADWDPPQAGFFTETGSLIPDEMALSTPAEVGTEIWGMDGYQTSRSHLVMAPDFDPERAIVLQTGNPGVYGPPIGEVHPDGSITFSVDPFTEHIASENIWYATFAGGAPEGAVTTRPRLAVHSYVGGTRPRLWVYWQVEGVHRAACLPLTNRSDFVYTEDSALLPADFPMDAALAGEEITVVHTIYGGGWWGHVNYLALRFDTINDIPEEPLPMFHFTRSIRSNAGTLRLGAAVVIRDTGTLDEITVPIFSDVDGLVPLDPTFTATEGVIDFYVDEPMIVDIAVTPIGGAEVVLSNVWVGQTLLADDVENPTTVADHTHTAAEVGAADDAHTHTAVQVGAIPAEDVDEIVTVTQAEYDAIVTPDPDILYVIREVV